MRSDAEQSAKIALIDALCDRFEDSWKKNSPATIESLLEQIEELHRSHLFAELLEIERQACLT